MQKFNRMHKYLLLLIVPVALNFFSSFANAASIEGSVVLDESVDQSTVDLSEQVVRLSIYKNNKEIAAAETKCNTQGQFSFNNLESGEEYSYLYYTLFQGVPYVGESLKFNPNQETLQLDPLQVYASTSSLSAIQSSETFFFSIGDNDVMKVVQQVRLVNTGEKTYHLDPNNLSQAIVYKLMSGAYDLRFISGIYTSTFELNEEQESLSFKEDLFPGEGNVKTLKFSYLVPIKNRQKNYSNQMAVDRKNINVFIDRPSVKFSAAPLKKQADMQMFGKMQQLYKGGPIPANTPISFEFKALPTTAVFTLKIIVYGALLALLLFAALVVYDKKTYIGQDEKKEKIYQTLLGLENKFKQGTVSKAFYLRQKNSLIEYLLCLEKQKHEG
ncbi:hypothetical protein MRY82_10015 [bacterium]|nr:hypothetical protein [bacterium]